MNSLRQHLNDHILESIVAKQPKPAEQQTTKPTSAPGQIFRDRLKIGGEGPQMIIIPAGHFLMGAPSNESGRRDSEGPQHEVHIAKPFAIGVYAITFDDYDLFCKNTQREKSDDEGWGREKRSAINVSWHDEAYCTWLSEQTGLRYQLPSEAAWENACRADISTPYYFEERISKDQANFDLNIEKTTPAGSYPANLCGLYDMHGNVWERCQDEWHNNYEDAPLDGSPRKDGKSGTRGFAVVLGSVFQTVCARRRATSIIPTAVSAAMSAFGYCVRLSLNGCSLSAA